MPQLSPHNLLSIVLFLYIILTLYITMTPLTNLTIQLHITSSSSDHSKESIIYH